MCRTQGRRCESKWADANRERYNARRRVVRNSEKAAWARNKGNDTKADYYEALAKDAQIVADKYDAEITSHEAESNNGTAQPTQGSETKAERCPECGQFAASGHSCPGTAFRNSAIRDEDGNLLVCHHGASTDFDTWDPEYTGTGNDSWGSGFYFTDDLERAQSYGEHTKSVVLNVTNPIMMDGVAESGMEGFYFTSEQAETILRRHPDIYRQPNDDEEMNPLGDYSQEFFDKDEWSKEEIDGMISRVAKENFDDTSWSNLEGMFPGGKSAEFRRGVQEATGHDGVVTDFKEEGRNVIAWFPEQVHEVGSSSPEPQQETTSSSSAPAAEAPKPVAQPKAVSVPQSAGADQAEGGERCGQCGRWVGASHECPQKAELESLRKDSAKWRKSWKKAETEAFVAYGSVLHADINSKLRNNQPLSVDEAKTVRDLDSALARTPQADHERTLFRSFSLSTLRGDAPVDEWVDARFPEGEVVSLDAYTSVTPNHAVSEEFTGAMSEYTDGGVVMEVRTKQSGYTGESHESEVLLRRGSRFEVVSSSESVEMEGKKFRKVILQEKVSRFGATPSLEHPLAAKPAEPMEIPYIRNTVSSTNHVKNDPQYGQDVEPAGRYLSESGGFTPEGWESGTVRFEKPLHITWGDSGSYTEDDNWKRRLSGFYGGKKGKALSKAVQADGYDAIVTHGEHGTSEIVDLTSMR